jgi:S1-C subfamily serine protease
MKWIVLLMALVLSVGCARQGTPPATAHAVSAAADLASKTVALVEVDEDDGQTRAYCSGVWVSQNEILTAAHCVHSNPLAALFGLEDEAIRFVVRSDVFPDGQTEAKYPTTHQAFRLRVDEDLDLALLSVPAAPEHLSAKVSGRPIVQVMAAQTMGHPKGLWWSYSNGAVAAVREIPGAGESPAMWWVQTTAPISPGNSGCGLFNAEGELIGIASWKNIGRGAEALGFFVHRDHISAFLKGAT